MYEGRPNKVHSPSTRLSVLIGIVYQSSCLRPRLSLARPAQLHLLPPGAAAQPKSAPCSTRPRYALPPWDARSTALLRLKNDNLPNAACGCQSPSPSALIHTLLSLPDRRALRRTKRAGHDAQYRLPSARVDQERAEGKVALCVLPSRLPRHTLCWSRRPAAQLVGNWRDPDSGAWAVRHDYHHLFGGPSTVVSGGFEEEI